MISFQSSIQRAAIGAVLILGSLGLAVAPGHAAPPAPAGPAAPPALYTLQGDTTNTGSSTTYFNSSGSWRFTSTGPNSTAIVATCKTGAVCTGLHAEASGTGISTTVSNTTAANIYGIFISSQDTLATGTSYGGYFVAANANGNAVGVRAIGDTVGVYGRGITGVSGHGIGVGGIGVYAESDDADAIYAWGGERGVYAVGGGIGVWGSSPNNTGVMGTGHGVGVLGVSNGAGSTNIGVYGQVTPAPAGSIAVAGMISGSVSYAGVFTNPTGTALWGVSTSDRGVLGTSTSYYGVVGSSGSSTGVRAASTSGTGLYATTSTGGTALRAKHNNAGAGNYAGIFDGNVVINGDFSVTGSKNNRVPTSKGDVLLYAEESTVTRYSDQGTATLKDGRAVIAIDPLFAETVDLRGDYQVFVTPYSFDSIGLAVGNLTPTSFEVREMGKGHGSFKFSWRISALRKGYGTQRLAPAAPLPPAEK